MVKVGQAKQSSIRTKGWVGGCGCVAAAPGVAPDGGRAHLPRVPRPGEHLLRPRVQGLSEEAAERRRRHRTRLRRAQAMGSSGNGYHYRRRIEPSVLN